MNVGKAAKKGKPPCAATFDGIGQALPLLSHLAATDSLPDYVRSALPHLKPALNQAHFEKMVNVLAQRLHKKQTPLLEHNIAVVHFLDGASTSTGGNSNYLYACYAADTS